VNIEFEKYSDGLVPAVVQDSKTRRILMLGFMDREALSITRSSARVTFYSRSKRQIWTKGETSGNFLDVDDILIDCDNDTILIKATPTGPTCHTGWATCFNEENERRDFLFVLEKIILDRKLHPRTESYTSRLFDEGLNRITQKVGEEAIEVVIAAMDDNTERLKSEIADLFYHLLVMLSAKEVSLTEVLEVLEARDEN